MDFSAFLKRNAIYIPALAAAAGLFLLFRSWSYDDPYITYRYAFNLIQGNGFVYNAGERILSTTTPLFTALLAILGQFWNNLPVLANLIGAVCLGLSVLFFFKICAAWRMPVAGWAGVLLLPTFSVLPATLSSETPMYVMFALALIYAYITGRYVAAGILAALLVLTRPDGILLPIVLAIHYLVFIRKPVPWSGLALFAGISAAAWGAIWIYFGSPLPVTLEVKHQQGLMTISQGFVQGLLTTLAPQINQAYFIVEIGLALFGIFWLISKKSPGLILIVWTVFYFISYSLLGVTRYFWYYAPLVPGFVLLVGTGLDCGFQWVRRQLRSSRISWLILILFVAGLFIFQSRNLLLQSQTVDTRINIYRAVGNWLRENTAGDSKIGALEIGAIGYYSQRPIVDFAGLIQPEYAKLMSSRTNYSDIAIWAITHSHPDYVVLFQNNQKSLIEYASSIGCQEQKKFMGIDYGFTDNLVVEKCSYKE